MTNIILKKDGNRLEFQMMDNCTRIGYLVGFIEKQTAFGIDSIHVNPDRRKENHGRELLERLEYELKKMGVGSIHGEFIPQKGITREGLRKFYEKLNYTVVKGDIEKKL